MSQLLHPLTFLVLGFFIIGGCSKGPESSTKRAITIRIGTESQESEKIRSGLNFGGLDLGIPLTPQTATSFNVSGCPMRYVVTVSGPNIDLVKGEFPPIPISLTDVNPNSSTALPTVGNVSFSIPPDFSTTLFVEGSGPATIEMTGYFYASSFGCNENEVAGAAVDEVNFISNGRTSFNLESEAEVSISPRFYKTGFGATTTSITFTDPNANAYPDGYGLGTFYVSGSDMPCTTGTFQAIGVEDRSIDRGAFRFYQNIVAYTNANTIYIGPVFKEHLYEVTVYCADPANASGIFYSQSEMLFGTEDTKNLGADWNSAPPPWSPPVVSGDIDLFISTNTTTQVCVNDGLGSFASASCTNLNVDSAVSNGILSGDIDGDGDSDLIILNTTQNRICKDQGAGVFICTYLSGVSRDSKDGALVDFDLDGDLDLVVANDGTPSEVCQNLTGNGVFGCTDFNSGRASDGVAVGDYSGDGKPDIVLANSGTDLDQACVNNGSLAFTCSDLSASNINSAAAVLYDVDSDGDLDALIAVANGAASIQCLNVSGVLGTCTSITGVGVSDYRDLEIIDYDNDGDGDLILGDYGGVSQLCENTTVSGVVSFSCADLDAAASGTAMGIVSGDFNIDGYRDLAIARWGAAPLVCLNDTDGTGFTCGVVDSITPYATGVAIGNGFNGP